MHGVLHPRHILLDRTGRASPSSVSGRLPAPDARKARSFGNPHFLGMPEQFAGLDRTVPQTDVYALAEVVFLLLSGSFPFQEAGGIEQLLSRKESGSVPSVRMFRPELPHRVDLTLQRAMALRSEDRYRSAGQFVEELDGALQLGRSEDKKWWQIWR